MLLGASPRDMITSSVALLKAFIHVKILECIHPSKEMNWKYPNIGDEMRCKGDGCSLVTIAYEMIGKNHNGIRYK